jgi:hypothetical protein
MNAIDLSRFPGISFGKIGVAIAHQFFEKFRQRKTVFNLRVDAAITGANANPNFNAMLIFPRMENAMRHVGFDGLTAHG